MNKIKRLIISLVLLIPLSANAGQQSDFPISISSSGNSAQGTLSDTYNDSSSNAYFYCGVNSGAILCLGQDAGGDSFGCYLSSSASGYNNMRELVLSMTPKDRFYISASDSVCSSFNVYKDSKYAG